MLKEQANFINEKLIELFVELSKAGFKATEDVFNAAINTYGAVGEFIEAMEAEEEEDENMNPETTKLPNIDDLFEAPVNDFVTASIQFAINGGKTEQQALFEAAMNLKAYQEGYEPEEFEPCEDCDCCLAEDEGESLLEVIYAAEANHYDNVNVFMTLIEQGLDNAETFDEEDLELIRYYLKNLPDNSDYDIDMLSPRALELAYKKHKYLRTIK
jgi:hypothetical protein